MTRFIVTAAALASAAILSVFAGGIALYWSLEPHVGTAGAAAIVALSGALIIACYALYRSLQANRRANEAAAAQQSMMESLPLGIGEFAEQRPFVSMAIALVGGLLAARNPALVSTLSQFMASMNRR